MKKLISTLVLVLLIFAGAGTALAKEYGVNPETKPVRYVVTDGKKLNVREEPATSGALLKQLVPGDVVYFESDETVSSDGYEWLPIMHRWGDGRLKTGYVTNLQRFAPEDNPLYQTPEEIQQQEEIAVEKTQDTVKWILLGLIIVLAIAGLFIYYVGSEKGSLIGKKKNGMRRTFFYNKEPYMATLITAIIILLAAIAGIIVLLAVGGVGFCLMWLIKILCFIVMWIGIIGCVLGIIACVCGAFVGIIPAILGGIIWAYDDEITYFGDMCADAGLTFFNRLNVLGFSWELVQEYWVEALLIAAAPIALFLCMALLWLLIAGTFILVERIMTHHYNIKHPCPHCQQPSEPAVYLSRGSNGYEEIPNDIALRPGMYGLFHITHPETGERMPTMLLNGRDKLARRCANCGHVIQADEGTECHLALVGSPKAGKSTLTYRIIADIMRTAGKERVEFTDVKNSIKDRNLTTKVESIAKNGRINEADMPAKTATDDLASTQLIIRRKNLPMPYRLFINDVGGEVFDPNSSANTGYASRFFHNVDSVLLLLDPFTTDFSDCALSDAFKKWYGKHSGEISGQLPVNDLRTAIDNNLNLHGKSCKHVHLNIVLPKCDTGYIPSDIDIDSQDDLKRFLNEDLDLGNLLHWAQNFASVNVFAISAVSPDNKSHIKPMIDEIIVRQLGINI